MTPFPQLAELDKAIASLSQGNGDPIKIAIAITNGIKFLGSVIENLKEQNADLMEDCEELMDKVEELETDQEVILQFLQTQGIDITYIVRKEESDDSDTSKESN